MSSSDRFTALIDCRIRHGGFSGERVFSIKTAGDPGEYCGLSPVGECFNSDTMQPIGRDDPPPNILDIRGYLRVHVVGIRHGDPLVVLPDNCSVVIPVHTIAYREEIKTTYVRFMHM